MIVAGWLPGRRLSMQLKVQRQEERMQDAAALKKGCHAKLIVGSLHDDALLLVESLSIEAFPSPYIVSLVTRSDTSGCLSANSKATNKASIQS